MKLAHCLAAIGCLAAATVAGSLGQGCSSQGGVPGDAGVDVVIVPSAGDGAAVSAEIDAGNEPLTACVACLFGGCTVAYSVCLSDPDCLALVQCASVPSCAADPTGACETSCISAASESSQSLYAALGTCQNANQCGAGACTAACAPAASTCAPPGDDAGSADAGSPADAAAASSCAACLAADCASQSTACGAGTSCAAYDTCVLGCTETELCPEACTLDSPSGSGAAQALATCARAACPICAQGL